MCTFRKIMFGIFVMGLVLVFLPYSYALNNVLDSTTYTIGEDKIPYTIYKIQKTAGYKGLELWIQNNYTDDSNKFVYYLPETLLDITVEEKPAIAFKTWEYKNYVQNIVVDTGKFLILYSTPHGEYNLDGINVFQEVLGLTIPQTQYTFLTEYNHFETEEKFIENTSSIEEDNSIEYTNEFNLTEEEIRIVSIGVASTCSKGNFGAWIGSYNGVSAYSNGSTCYVSNSYNYYNGYKTGMKWQCVEYVDRYFKVKFNRNITGGNANTYYSNASSKGLNRAPNGGTNGPQMGNIITSAGGPHGHVAIVREVGSNYIKVIHQNWCNCSSDKSKTLSMSVTTKNGKKYYTVSGFNSSYPIQGWLWPK